MIMSARIYQLIEIIGIGRSTASEIKSYLDAARRVDKEKYSKCYISPSDIKSLLKEMQESGLVFIADKEDCRFEDFQFELTKRGREINKFLEYIDTLANDFSENYKEKIVTSAYNAGYTTAKEIAAQTGLSVNSVRRGLNGQKVSAPAIKPDHPLDFIEKLNSIRETSIERIQACTTVDELRVVKHEVLGKDGVLSSHMRGLSEVSADTRAELGKILNDARAYIEAAHNLVLGKLSFIVPPTSTKPLSEMHAPDILERETEHVEKVLQIGMDSPHLSWAYPKTNPMDLGVFHQTLERIRSEVRGFVTTGGNLPEKETSWKKTLQELQKELDYENIHRRMPEGIDRLFANLLFQEVSEEVHATKDIPATSSQYVPPGVYATQRPDEPGLVENFCAKKAASTATANPRFDQLELTLFRVYRDLQPWDREEFPEMSPILGYIRTALGLHV